VLSSTFIIQQQIPHSFSIVSLIILIASLYNSMKLIVYSVTLPFALVVAKRHLALPRSSGSLDTWAPGGVDDFRGPCPMMNTLANHNFLPHDGGNITLENAVSALTTALNFNENVAIIMWQQAVIVNPDPNATFFTL